MKFASFVRYHPDAARIAERRPAHRAYLAELHAQGRLLLAGPFTDDSGALFVHEAADAAEVAALVAADPFADGVFAEVQTRPWKPVFIGAAALAG